MLVKGLKLLPRLSVSAPHRNCASKMSGAAQPMCPKFISLEDRGIITKIDNSNSSRFRVVSYNILAQVYVKSSLFPHSPSPCLKWKARSQSIVTVLNSLDADFLCIQELDEYDTFYKGKMESQGYSSIYIQRSGQKRDGCGIFYKSNSAELMLEEVIQYNDLVKSVEDETECGNESSDLLERENREATSIEGTTVAACTVVFTVLSYNIRFSRLRIALANRSVVIKTFALAALESKKI